MKIVIIGSGNVAHAFGRLCLKANHRVMEVFGRNTQTTTQLASELDADPIFSWDKITLEADIYIVALPDQVIPEIHHSFRLRKGMVVHTAGSVPMDALKEVAPNYGVLYPLQSLRAEVSHYSNIPILVDGNTADDKTLIADFAASLSGQVAYAGDEQRLHLHLAGVWVSNFSNYLFTIAWDICHQKGVDFRLLLPLMEHTVGRLHHFTPVEMQTGPAIRNDTDTIQKHMHLLQQNPEAREIYRLLTEAIANYHVSESK